MNMILNQEIQTMKQKQIVINTYEKKNTIYKILIREFYIIFMNPNNHPALMEQTQTISVVVG